jgi:murein DD-endopeptidase MepM/ murein hydrolase activator NlpD
MAASDGSLSYEEFMALDAPAKPKEAASSDGSISYEEFMALPNAPGSAGGNNVEKQRANRTAGEIIGDVGSQLGKGVNTIAGAIPNLLDPSSPVSKFFNDNAQYWQNDQSQITKSLEAAADERIKEAAKTGQWEAFKTAVVEYGAEPALVQKLILENIPSMIPGLAAAKGAQIAAKGSVLAGTIAGAGTNSVLNAGGARQEAYQDTKKTLIERGMTESEADAKALEMSILPATVGGVMGAVSGGTGLERGILGGAKGGFTKRLGIELGGEQLEEVTPGIATNLQLGRDPLSGVGETSAKTLIASSPGAVVSGFHGQKQDPTKPPEDILKTTNTDELVAGANNFNAHDTTSTEDYVAQAKADQAARAQNQAADMPVENLDTRPDGSVSVVSTGTIPSVTPPPLTPLPPLTQSVAETVTPTPPAVTTPTQPNVETPKVQYGNPLVNMPKPSSLPNEHRINPVTGKDRPHKGTDYPAVEGTAVQSTAEGTVEFAGKKTGYGNVVIIKHPDNSTTLYAHLNNITDGLKTGVQVAQGQQIGGVGSTGNSTGNHLHYEHREHDGKPSGYIHQQHASEWEIAQRNGTAPTVDTTDDNTQSAADELRSRIAVNQLPDAPVEQSQPDVSEPPVNILQKAKEARIDKLNDAILADGVLEGNKLTMPDGRVIELFPNEIAYVENTMRMAQGLPVQPTKGQNVQETIAATQGSIDGLTPQTGSAVGDVQKQVAQEVAVESAQIISLRKKLSAADQANDLNGIYTAAKELDAAIIPVVQARIDSGEMPVFKGKNLTYAVHPATDSIHAYQVTRYGDDGALGDTRYNTLEEAVRDSRLSTIDMLTSNAAIAEMNRLAKAESGYQGRRTSQPAPVKIDKTALKAASDAVEKTAEVVGKEPSIASAEPKLIKTRSSYGDTVHLMQSDIDGNRVQLPIYTSKGERTGKSIHRENLDQSGEKLAALNAENIDNPAFDLITSKDGRTFASQPAAQRELNKRALSDTHEIVPAAELQDGVTGFVIRKKRPTQAPQSEPAQAAAESKAADTQSTQEKSANNTPERDASNIIPLKKIPRSLEIEVGTEEGDKTVNAHKEMRSINQRIAKYEELRGCL